MIKIVLILSTFLLSAEESTLKELSDKNKSLPGRLKLRDSRSETERIRSSSISITEKAHKQERDIRRKDHHVKILEDENIKLETEMESQTKEMEILENAIKKREELIKVKEEEIKQVVDLETTDLREAYRTKNYFAGKKELQELLKLRKKDERKLKKLKYENELDQRRLDRNKKIIEAKNVHIEGLRGKKEISLKNVEHTKSELKESKSNTEYYQLKIALIKMPGIYKRIATNKFAGKNEKKLARIILGAQFVRNMGKDSPIVHSQKVQDLLDFYLEFRKREMKQKGEEFDRDKILEESEKKELEEFADQILKMNEQYGDEDLKRPGQLLQKLNVETSSRSQETREEVVEQVEETKEESSSGREQ